MKPVDCLHAIPKPDFCKEESLAYISWGFGLTPSYREQTVPLLVFAWDRLLQLVYFLEDGSFEFDGFYYSNREIIGVQFVSDSVLMII